MNRFMGSGRLPRAAVVNGNETKAVKFTLASCYGQNNKTGKKLVGFVPCVVFAPDEGLQKLLTENWRGVVIEVEGHVATSKFESKGETKYSTEVVVDRKGIRPVSEVDDLPYLAPGDKERAA